MAARALTLNAVAARTGVAPKTVQRWLAGRVPHARHRWAIAALVREDEAYLWPTAAPSRRRREQSRDELIALYPHRADVPADVWRLLLETAHEQIGVLVYAA